MRWNSTYMMIERAIKLRDSVDQYCFKLTQSADEADKNTQLDELSSADWEILVKIKSILKPFFITTKHLERNAIDGSHGALWEVVLGIECLIQYLEDQHTRLKNDIGTVHLTTSVALALDKLEDYLGKTNRSAVWLAAIVLHPKHKWFSITTLWEQRNKISLLNASKIRVQNMWAGFYQDKILIPENDVSQYDSYVDSDGEDDPFHGLLNTRTIRADPDAEVVDEYVKYINKDRDEDVRNPLQWWRDHQSIYPNLAQMAFDLFAIPAMSSECERSFSKASYTISARRSNLSNDIVESGEALRSWVSAGVVKLGAPSSSISDMT